MFSSRLRNRLALPAATFVCAIVANIALAQTPAPAPNAAPEDTAEESAASGQLEQDAAPTAAAAPAEGPAQEPAVSATGEAMPDLPVEKVPDAPAPQNFKTDGKPLFFPPENNGIKLERPQLRWVIDDGTKINIGGLKLDANSGVFRFTQTLRDQTPKGFLDPDQRGRVATHISFTWPDSIAPTGLLTIEGAKGEVLLSTEVTEESRAEWRKRLAHADDVKGLKAHLRSAWGLADIPREKFAFLWKGGVMRACLASRASKDESMRLCTTPVQVSVKGEVLRARLAPQPTNATVTINGGDVGPRGIVTFPNNKVANLKVKFSTGALIEFNSRPIDIKLIDVVEDSSGTGVTITGEGNLPAGNVTILQQPETHFWAKTGITQKTIWRVTIPRSAPTLRALGSFNIPFTLLVNFNALPKESERLYIPDYGSGDRTYSSSPRLIVTGPKNARVQSNERSVKSLGDGRYEWTFAAPELAAENRSRIAVKTGKEGRAWIANYKLFRTYAYESSLRLTGVATADGQLVVLGEAAGSAWFENLGFTDHDILAHHRWGLTARYFQSFTPIKIADKGAEGGVTSVSEFSVANFDLKYNIVSGLWNHDELFGLVASVERITFGTTGALLVGGGAYWARTMPKIFDDLFNLLPFMEYPKYVDMEYIVYPLALSQGTQPGTTMSLNFHGKVFWSKRIYGEAGFGLKRFAYIDKDMDISFNTFYGTVGLGVLF